MAEVAAQIEALEQKAVQLKNQVSFSMNNSKFKVIKLMSAHRKNIWKP